MASNKRNSVRFKLKSFTIETMKVNYTGFCTALKYVSPMANFNYCDKLKKFGNLILDINKSTFFDNQCLKLCDNSGPIYNTIELYGVFPRQLLSQICLGLLIKMFYFHLSFILFYPNSFRCAFYTLSSSEQHTDKQLCSKISSKQYSGRFKYSHDVSKTFKIELSAALRILQHHVVVASKGNCRESLQKNGCIISSGTKFNL